MTRSSNGLTMSGARFVGSFWRKQTRGYGEKLPWKHYVPKSKLYRIRRFIGKCCLGPSMLSEPEDTYMLLGSYTRREVLKMIEQKKFTSTEYIQQEGGVGWESAPEFYKRMSIKKKRQKTKSVSKRKKFKKGMKFRRGRATG